MNGKTMTYPDRPTPESPQYIYIQQPAKKNGVGRTVAIILGTVAVVVVALIVLLIALPDDDDGDGSGQPLDSRWAALVTPTIADHVHNCQGHSYELDNLGTRTTTDGILCATTGGAGLGSQDAEFLTDSRRVEYLREVLDGTLASGAHREVFRNEGNVRVGTSDAEGDGYTLYYLDSSRNLSLEIVSFPDAGTARAAAGEMGML